MAKVTIFTIARACHEANRHYCEMTGDKSQKPWVNAPDWQKDSCIKGVLFHIDHPDATPENSHESWLAHKKDNGWAYGEVKDEVKKLHPCFRPYSELPLEQKVKDALFKSIVEALRVIRDEQRAE